MCELVRNGRIGEVKRVEVGLKCSRPGGSPDWSPEPAPKELDYDLWLGPAPYVPYHSKRVHYNFRFVRDYSGGEMTNWGAHYFDIVQWGLGMDNSGPVEISGKGHRHKSGMYDVFRQFHLEMTYPNGAVMQVRPGGGSVKFIGTEGWISGADRGEPESMLRSSIGPDEIHLARPHGSHMDEFFHAIRTRRQPTAPVESGHRTATVCHLGNITLELGRPVKWDPVKEEFPGDDEANRLTWRPWRSPWKL
jgi:predicted dehydrogenase